MTFRSRFDHHVRASSSPSSTGHRVGSLRRRRLGCSMTPASASSSDRRSCWLPHLATTEVSTCRLEVGLPGSSGCSTSSTSRLPDLNGNNLIDSLRGVVANGRAALLVLVPGKDETLRLNGEAWVVTDPAVLDRWDDELRRPTTAIVIRADEVFMHCAKAFRRSNLWDPASWDALADAPDGLDVLKRPGSGRDQRRRHPRVPRAELRRRPRARRTRVTHS